MTQGKKSRITAIGLVILVAVAVQAEDPPVDAVLDTARFSAMPSGIVMRGELRIEDRAFPLEIRTGAGQITYDFREGADYRMDIGRDSASLLANAGNGWKDVPREEMTDPLHDSDISLSDLSLEFLYWPKSQIIGEETLLARKTWKIRLNPKYKKGDYGVVVVNIEQGSGALMQAECYGWEGEFLKRFKVRKVQKIGEQWYLKQMRVDSMVPGTPRVASSTYIDILEVQ